MAKFEDYLPGGEKDPNAPAEGIEGEIQDAANQQEARQDGATPPIDWEQRYKELEKLNSRQAQTLGEYRKTIDDFIANPTPASEADPEPASQPITVDDVLEDPNSAVARAVESHPAIREARKLKEQYEAQQKEAALADFQTRHPDYSEIAGTPEFQNWVVENPTRVELYSRGNSYDFSAADALFSLYKAERGLSDVQRQSDISQAELVESSHEMVQEPPTYSRSEYINKLKRAKQGDLEAEDWVKAHAANYRMALASGNVRD